MAIRKLPKRRSTGSRIGEGIFAGLEAFGQSMGRYGEQQRTLKNQAAGEERRAALDILKDAKDKVAAGTWTPAQASAVTGIPAQAFSAMQPSIESGMSAAMGDITKASTRETVPSDAALAALPFAKRLKPTLPPDRQIPSEPDEANLQPTLEAHAPAGVASLNAGRGVPGFQGSPFDSPEFQSLLSTAAAKRESFPATAVPGVDAEGNRITTYRNPSELKSGLTVPQEPTPEQSGRRAATSAVSQIKTEGMFGLPKMRGEADLQKELASTLSDTFTKAKTKQEHDILMGSQLAPDVVTAGVNKEARSAAARRNAEMQVELNRLGIPAQKQSAVLQLADNFSQASKPFYIRQEAFRDMVNFAKQATPYSDISMIFAFMRAQDGSTVKEAEAKLASHAEGISSAIQNAWDKVKSGRKLDDVERADMVRTVATMYQGSAQEHKLRIQDFTAQAAGLGVPPGLIVRQPAEDLMNQAKTPGQRLREY